MKTICLYMHIAYRITFKFKGDSMSVIIDTEKCGKIENCPGEGLCIKLCEQRRFSRKKQ